VEGLRFSPLVERDADVVCSLLEDWGSGLWRADPVSWETMGEEPTLIPLPDIGGLL